MAILEAEGFITQPHTSAGRVPTEAAYKYYIKHLLGGERPESVRINITLRHVIYPPSIEDQLREMGEEIARASGDAVMMATSKPWSVTLGLGNLLRKPDFRTEESILRLAESLEQFDAALKQFLISAHDDVRVVLGEENPFGSHLASVVVRHRLPGGLHGIMSIVGPMRMDYARNIALLNKAKQILEQPLLLV